MERKARPAESQVYDTRGVQPENAMAFLKGCPPCGVEGLPNGSTTVKDRIASKRKEGDTQVVKSGSEPEESLQPADG